MFEVRQWIFRATVFMGIGVIPQVISASAFFQTNLTSDIPGLANNTDPNLVNPWGISFSATSPFWISDNRSGVSTLYNAAGQPFPINSPLVVTIPAAAGGSSPGLPTGTVASSSGFEIAPGKPAAFIFATEDGTISGWNPSVNATNAVVQVDNSSTAVYKGLAIGSNSSGSFLYASNFKAGTIDVFDSKFQPATLAGSFKDPSLPAGFAPFDIQSVGSNLYVTYAKQDANGQNDVAGAGNGFVDVFDTNGNLVRRLISNGPLNSPWGLAVAPASFGSFAGNLLVGNFGDGTINAFDPITGQFMGQMQDAAGNPIFNEGLWALQFGNGSVADSNTLYFTAGIPGGGQKEDHGLFGDLQPVSAPAAVPEPGTVGTVALGLIGLASSAFVRKKRISQN
ncbi:MAG: hypothetical protein JWO48_3414 [Bryobacterales bacterium]|nr:hypothetical protein [Bryobacterales bacterium]